MVDDDDDREKDDKIDHGKQLKMCKNNRPTSSFTGTSSASLFVRAARNFNPFTAAPCIFINDNGPRLNFELTYNHEMIIIFWQIM